MILNGKHPFDKNNLFNAGAGMNDAIHKQKRIWLRRGKLPLGETMDLG
jgi:hypothetical protein